MQAKYGDIERVIAQHAELLEAKCLDAERVSMRHAELTEAKCLECCSVASEELTSKLEGLRQDIERRLRDAEKVAAQQQLELRAMLALQQSHTSEKQGNPHTTSLDLLRFSVEGSLQDFRGEMKAALEEERTNSIERAQALGQALRQDVEQSIITQAMACARKEACDVSYSVVSKWEPLQSEFQQLAVRLPLIESHLYELQSAVAGTRTHTAVAEFEPPAHSGNVPQKACGVQMGTLVVERAIDASSRSSSTGADMSMEEPQTQAHLLAAIAAAAGNATQGATNDERERLEQTLQAIITKLDSQCIDNLAPDLKQLNSLLSDNAPTASPSAADIKLFSAPSALSPASASTEPPGRAHSPGSTQGSSTQGIEIQKLRDDILGYLRSDLPKLVSSTLGSMQLAQESAHELPPVQMGLLEATAGTRSGAESSNEVPPSQMGQLSAIKELILGEDVFTSTGQQRHVLCPGSPQLLTRPGQGSSGRFPLGGHPPFAERVMLERSDRIISRDPLRLQVRHSHLLTKQTVQSDGSIEPTSALKMQFSVPQFPTMQPAPRARSVELQRTSAYDQPAQRPAQPQMRQQNGGSVTVLPGAALGAANLSRLHNANLVNLRSPRVSQASTNSLNLSAQGNLDVSSSSINLANYATPNDMTNGVPMTLTGPPRLTPVASFRQSRIDASI